MATGTSIRLVFYGLQKKENRLGQEGIWSGRSWQSCLGTAVCDKYVAYGVGSQSIARIEHRGG